MASAKCRDCNNRTKDPSGLCHVHRAGPASISGIAPKPQPGPFSTPTPASPKIGQPGNEMARVHERAKEASQFVKGSSVSTVSLNNGSEIVKVFQESGYRNAQGKRMQVETQFNHSPASNGVTMCHSVRDPSSGAIIYDSSLSDINTEDADAMREAIRNPRVGMYSPADNRGLSGVVRRLFGRRPTDDELNRREGGHR